MNARVRTTNLRNSKQKWLAGTRRCSNELMHARRHEGMNEIGMTKSITGGQGKQGNQKQWHGMAGGKIIANPHSPTTAAISQSLPGGYHSEKTCTNKKLKWIDRMPMTRYIKNTYARHSVEVYFCLSFSSETHEIDLNATMHFFLSGVRQMRFFECSNT